MKTSHKWTLPFATLKEEGKQYRRIRTVHCKGRVAISRGMEVPMRSLVGEPAFPFNLSDAEGKTHSLDDYRNSWLLMVFHRHLG